MPERTQNNAQTSLDNWQPPTLIGDHIALDFLNSIAAPAGIIIEWIENGSHLVTWMVEANVITSTDAEDIRAQFPKRDIDQIAKDAIILREWFRELLFQVKANGITSLQQGDIDRLNDILTQDTSYSCIKNTGETGLHLVTHRSWRTSRDLLAPIAAAIADLLCEGNLSLVSKCSNPPCTMWFYDRTKGHRRRWCSQAVCGNRAKVAAFRDRQNKKAKSKNNK